MKHASLIACGLLLTACAQYRPAATADQVLARQYAARSIHGAMTGAEAQAIAESYRKAIGTRPADPPESVPIQ
jgi:hypothetical protein